MALFRDIPCKCEASSVMNTLPPQNSGFRQVVLQCCCYCSVVMKLFRLLCLVVNSEVICNYTHSIFSYLIMGFKCFIKSVYFRHDLLIICYHLKRKKCSKLYTLKESKGVSEENTYYGLFFYFLKREKDTVCEAQYEELKARILDATLYSFSGMPT